MEITLNKVETMIDAEVKVSKNSTSAYVYLPKEYAGKKVKICVMK